MKFGSLLKKYDSAKSIENGSERLVRHNVYSEEGIKATKLYEKAVGIMKARSEKDQSDPYGWTYQAGIHGTFWTDLETLAQQGSKRGFAEEDQIYKGDSLLNNCTHFSSLWNEAARLGEKDSDQAIANSITINFLPWHRLYLKHFESVVRHVLSESGEKGANKWALPYWDYTVKGQDKIPEIFLNTKSSLYESSRSIKMQNGASLSDLQQPRSTIALGTDLVGKQPSTFFDFQKLGREKAQEQTLFRAFATYVEQNPHNNMHDAVGGIADSITEKAELWKYTTNYAEDDGIQGLWGRDNDTKDNGLKNAINSIDYIFGKDATLGPGLMGFVPTAAREPLFWLHHSFIDKIWSEWNSSPNASYLQAEELRRSPWNYQFFEPAKNDGSVKIKTYSHWGSNPSEVIASVYNPGYRYDTLEGPAKEGSPNPALAILDQPEYRPTVKQKDIDSTVNEIAYKSMDLGLPIDANEVLRLRKQGISLTMELDYSVPMSAGQNIAILVGDNNFLQDNSSKIRNLWETFEPGTSDGKGQLFNDPEWGKIFDNRGGEFAPSNLEDFAVGTINLLAMAPLESNSEASHAHLMNGQMVFDLTDSIYRQSQFNAISRKSKVGIMFAASDKVSGNDQTWIRRARVSLHKSLNTGGDDKDIITGSRFDEMQYLADHPELLKIKSAIKDPERYFKTVGLKLGHQRPTLKSRAKEIGISYMECNPDLKNKLDSNPYRAIDHYLSIGMKEGRALGGCDIHGIDSIPGHHSIESLGALSHNDMNSFL
jgi:hypothetical protein